MILKKRKKNEIVSHNFTDSNQLRELLGNQFCFWISEWSSQLCTQHKQRKPEKYSGLNGIRTHDLCDTSEVLYQLSYQANWELVTLWIRNVPVVAMRWKTIYENSYIWTAELEERMNKWMIMAVIYAILNISSFAEKKAWKKFAAVTYAT